MQYNMIQIQISILFKISLKLKGQKYLKVYYSKLHQKQTSLKYKQSKNSPKEKQKYQHQIIRFTCFQNYMLPEICKSKCQCQSQNLRLSQLDNKLLQLKAGFILILKMNLNFFIVFSLLLLSILSLQLEQHKDRQPSCCKSWCWNNCHCAAFKDPHKARQYGITYCPEQE